MANHNTVTVGTTATLLNALTDSSRGTSSLVAQSATAFFVGGPTVTSATGFPVAANSPFSVDLDNNELIYAAVATGTAAVSVLQSGI